MSGDPVQAPPSRVHVARGSIGFSAAHFSILAGQRERLHGHNYVASLAVTGPVAADGTVVDFADLKRALRAECAALDHRMLVPLGAPEVTVAPGETSVEVLVDGDRFVFPAADCVLLPVRNTTCECLAAHIGELVRVRLGDALTGKVLEVTLEESPGQGATRTCA